MFEVPRIIDSIKVKKNSIIIFDIDDTLIDTNDNPMYHIIYIYNYAKEKGLTPVIITARKGSKENIQRTHAQLKNSGITDYKGIFFLSEDLYDNTKDNREQIITSYKLQTRKYLAENGYSIEMSVGDMQWDIGEYGGIGILVN